MPGSGSVSRWRSQHVAMPGGPTPRAPSTAAEGGGGLFVVGKLRRDLKARPIFGLVFPEEAAAMNIATLYPFDEPFRDLSSGIDRRGT
jgi:hypothetical protein